MIYAKGKLKEFDCQCKSALCFFTIMQESTVNSLAEVRAEFKENIFVTSAYRCQSHNKSVGGVKMSNHCLGDAVDLVPANGQLHQLASIADKNFKYVKQYKKFIHCDNRRNKESL